MGQAREITLSETVSLLATRYDVSLSRQQDIHSQCELLLIPIGLHINQ